MPGGDGNIDGRIDRIARWFGSRGWEPFAFQQEVWQAYLNGESGLIHAPTGMGKTYAAWMGPVAEWFSEPTRSPQTTPASVPLRVLWITPLRALAADTEQSLKAPASDLDLPWTIERRTGDTPASVRERQRERLPTALITTPESLSLMLARSDAFHRFRDLRLVVVDEWHELLGTKRGVQTELCLVRLRRWRPELRTWGLSATLGNLDEARQCLMGGAGPELQDRVIDVPAGQVPVRAARQRSSVAGTAPVPDAARPSAVGTGPPSRLVRGLLPKTIRIDALIPDTMERFPWAGHLGIRMLRDVIAAIDEGTTAIVFTNTRSQTEIWYQAILAGNSDWAGLLALHHGSLDQNVRTWVEDGLRDGRLKCVVSTSSLDLGVDFSPVDRVLQVGSPKGVARLLQRAGRSGHSPGRESRVTCVPTHAIELIEYAATRSAVQKGIIESREPVEKPIDVLIQHAVTIALGDGFRAGELYDEITSSYSYRNLSREDWDWVLNFITVGPDQHIAHREYKRVGVMDGVYRVLDRQVARIHRMSIGTIVSASSMHVQYVKGKRLGTIEESFISRLRQGDRFMFAGRPLEFVRVRDMTAYVRKAPSPEGAIPRWDGGRMPLSNELSLELRVKLDEARRGVYESDEMEAVRHILEFQKERSIIPSLEELLIERTETKDGHHIFIFPFEGRLVHEGLAALFAFRIARLRPISFSLAMNDYGFELLSAERAPLEEAIENSLLEPGDLDGDIEASLNSVEMARRQFREVARVAGLVFQGYPGQGKSTRQLQASSGLIFDVFRKYDPENLLLKQAYQEVLENQLERRRMERALVRIGRSSVRVVDTERPTPLAFPILVDRLRDQVSSERLADRVRKLQIAYDR